MIHDSKTFIFKNSSKNAPENLTFCPQISLAKPSDRPKIKRIIFK